MNGAIPPDRIALVGLRGRGHHGVLAHERAEGQEFVVDVALQVSTASAAATDDLTLTVDYGVLAQRVVAEIEGEPVDLIETLAERIAAVALEPAQVGSVVVTVHKPSAPITVPFADVSVTVVRDRVPEPRAATRAVLALGSNLGDRVAHLRAAVAAISSAAGVEVLAVSPVYETEPVGGPPQPDYLTAVVLVETTLAPAKLLGLAHSVERARARARTEHWGPRTLDVDVVQMGDERAARPELTLPHPRAHERVFVLRPWLDVDPEAELLGHGPVRDLLAGTGTEGVHRRDDVVLEVPA